MNNEPWKSISFRSRDNMERLLVLLENLETIEDLHIESDKIVITPEE